MRENQIHVDTISLKSIVKLSQQELKKALVDKLTEQGYSPVCQKGFLYAEGNVSVLLVAHLDTVHKQPVVNICYSEDRQIMMSPEGIGGDDRCGIYMILEIIKQARCHVLFTEDEEIGCIGASDFAKSKIRPQVNYIVEVDRRGSNDAVFYQCSNLDFNEFVCCFGFEEARGSFSDISVIAPQLGVAAVNISAGYYNEHSRHEYINLAEMERNTRLICEMVQSTTEKYEYRERSYTYSQMALEDTRLWNFDGFGQVNRSKYLMSIPRDTSLVMEGYESSETDAYLIDNSGNVYRYLPELGSVVHSEGLEAYAPGGKRITYNRKLAKKMQILTLETALQFLKSQ
ncbi:M28 family peptidase [Anaerotignum sp.]|uniref:M28 family peptidase n=1 Tax=Anaerotignum sp. TaxID=2039241 RepID=UPI0028A6BC83|nr:M28 family peptidase [Anaerotignum sp.]